MSTADRPRVTPDIIRRQVVLEEHDTLPDGSGAVVVRRVVHDEWSYRSHLLMVRFHPGPGPGTGGGGRARAAVPVPLTRGAVRDSVPRVSPDGRRVAFLRSFPDEPDRPIALMVGDLGAGEPWPLIAPEHGVSQPCWSPDGRRLAFVAADALPRHLVRVPPKGRTPVARRIVRADWRMDEIGHRDRWDHLWVVDVRDGARPHQLTHGDFDVRSPAWSPDGRSIAYAADPRPEADLHPRPTIWVVPAVQPGPGKAGASAPVQVLAVAGYAESPAWSPDGRWIACSGVDVPEPLDVEVPGCLVGPADGSARPVALGPSLDRPIAALMDTDMNGWMASSRLGPFWDGPDGLVALITERGCAVPWRFPFDAATGRASGDPVRLVDAAAACWTLAVAAASESRPAVISVVGTLDDRPMELMTVERGGAPTARLRTWTGDGSRWRRGVPWPETRRLAVPGPGGPVDTWLASPAGAGDRSLPAIVDVHGGPLGGWAPAPSLETVLLCARGYRVILPNIRGSTGYGRAWIEAQLGDWGGVDAADIVAAVDHVVALGLADPDRLGLLGFSYGGFMVNWLVGAAPDRFRAAVSENGVTNQINGWSNSDTGPEYCRMARLGAPLSEEGVAGLWRQSPLRLVDRIRTPLLLLQAENDLRCPAADNEQLFIALRHLGREVEYVLYPESWHTYAITGRPDRRIDRNERMLAWFDRHLLGGGGGPAGRS